MGTPVSPGFYQKGGVEKYKEGLEALPLEPLRETLIFFKEAPNFF